MGVDSKTLSPAASWWRGVSGERKLIGAAIAAPLAIVLVAWVMLLTVMHVGASNSAPVAAALAFSGVVVTACVSIIGVLANRQAEKRLAQEHDQAEKRLAQEHDDERRRLQLDAAMQAAKLLSGADGKAADPSVIASGLLALVQLDQAALAVRLLVDLWNPKDSRVSKEAAILVIDGALRCGEPAAQLVAAELLCRNARRLEATESLDWPSAVEGHWDQDFTAKTKLLLVEALIKMTLNATANEAALRAVAVRLYGFWDSEDPQSPNGTRVRGCIGKLLEAIMHWVEHFKYKEFIEGNREVTLAELCRAAATAETNPDGYLDRMSNCYADKLWHWAKACTRQPPEDDRLPSLASAECGSRASGLSGVVR